MKDIGGGIENEYRLVVYRSESYIYGFIKLTEIYFGNKIYK